MKIQHYKEILILMVAVIMIFALSANLYAQDLRIIKIKGKVFLREEEAKPWRKAKKGEYLHNNYELKTKNRSECTFGFGKKINKALTLKQNSELKITNVTIGHLELSQGRVFSLIEKLDKGSSFQIRTPVAITGVRGTGWTVQADKQTSVKCFEGEVFVKGLDEEGNVVSDKDIKKDSGVQVSKSGKIDEPFALEEKDKKEWKSFRSIVKDFIGKPIGKVFGAVGGLTEGITNAYVGGEGENPFNR